MKRCAAGECSLRNRFHCLALAAVVAALTVQCSPSRPHPTDSEHTTSPSGNDQSCATVVDEAEDRPLRIASFNVDRLFDSICDSGDCGDRSFETAPPPRRYRRRLDRLAEGIADIEADILLLQEIEKADVLSDLAGALATQGSSYEVEAFGGDSEGGALEVGILARGEQTEETMRFRETRSLTRPDGSSTRFTREFLGLPLEIDGRRIVVFDAHFKSRRDDDPGRRLAEAEESGTIVAEEAAERSESLVVLGGDLNATADSEPLGVLTDRFDLRRAGGDSSPTPWTYCFGDRPEAIDHLLVAPNCGGGLVRGSARRWGGSQCPGTSGLADSDHAAVSADFALR